MNYALVRPDGTVENLCLPESCLGDMPEGYRALPNVPPEYNPEMYTLTVIEPVAPDAETLGYAITPIPLDVQRDHMSCSRRQMKQALTRMNLRIPVESAVEQGSQDLKDWWEDAATFERSHPEVIAIGEVLHQTPETIDDLFRLAVRL